MSSSQEGIQNRTLTERSNRPVRREFWYTSIGILFLLAFFGVTAIRAESRLFWYDELFTVHVSRQGGVAQIWEALTSGVDSNPPLVYLLAAFGERLVGPGELGIRLQAIIGFMVALASLFSFVQRRYGGAVGLIAIGLAASSGASIYATEARSYGLVLGFTSLALVFWQRRGDSPGQLVNLIGLWLALTGALLSHCYAIVVLPIFAASELVRWRRTGRFDYGLAFALMFASAWMLSYIPLRNSIQQFTLDSPIFLPTIEKVLDGCVKMLRTVGWLMVTSAAGAFALRIIQDLEHRDKDAEGFLKEEWVAALGLLATPLLAYVISLQAGGGYFPRYGVPAILGVSLVFAAALSIISHHHVRYLSAVSFAFLIWFFVGFIVQQNMDTIDLVKMDLIKVSKLVGEKRVVVIADGQTFLQHDYYAGPETAKNVRFLLDRESALKYMHTDCYDRLIPHIAPWFGVRGGLEKYNEFIKANREFYVYAMNDADHYWLVQRLEADGAQLDVVDRAVRREVIRVRMR